MLNVATWNVEWKTSRSGEASIMRERLFACQPEIACITEGYTDFFDEGHLISADADYGYPLIDGRRKVMLWSRQPWTETDQVGDPSLSSGRFISGRTKTSVGEVTVVGVCIPWRDAHVRTGRRDRAPWQDHLTYVQGLQRYLQNVGTPTILLGDFNQRVPRLYQPRMIYDALVDGLGERVSIATAGPLGYECLRSIDHIALSTDLSPIEVSILSKVDKNGRELSDHFGVAVRVTRKSRLVAGPTTDDPAAEGTSA